MEKDPQTIKAASAREGWIVPLVFALAVFVRFWRYLSADLARDAAITGVQSLSVLRGEFPLFFMGQKFMGSVATYMAAPLYLLAGPSALTANLPPVLFSLVTVWIMYLLLRRILEKAGSRLGLLTLAVPTSLGFYCLTEGKSIYLLPLLLSAFHLWITLEIVQSVRKTNLLLAAVWGLLAGLAFWINALSGVVIGAGLVFLLARINIRALPRLLGVMALGGVVGGLPLLLFALSQQSPWLGLVRPGSSYSIADRLSAILFNAWPIVLGINPSDNRAGLSFISPVFLVYLLLNGLLIWAVVGMIIKGRQSTGREILLPLLVLLLNGAAALAGGRPNDYWGQDQRYFLAAYLALPFCWGFLADRLGRRPLVVGVLAGLLLAVHLSGYATFKGRPLLRGLTSGYYFLEEGPLKRNIESLRADGLQHIYFRGEHFLPFLAGGDPVFAVETTPEDTLNIARVSAARQPAFRMPLAGSFRFLGTSFRNSDGLLHSYSEPVGVEGLVDTGTWRVFDLDGRSLGTALHDGDLATGFQTRGDNPDGQGFVLDLGRETLVGGLALIPFNFLQVPAGLRIETAGAGGRFEILREVRDYIGPFYQSGPHPFFMVRYPRIECYFTPRAVRYLRLTQLGRIREDWAVQEILVFTPGREANGLPWPKAAEKLLDTIRTHPLQKLYADAWPSSLLYSAAWRGRPRLLLPNLHVDPYGSMDPGPREPLLLDSSPGNGLLVLNRDVPPVARRLNRSGLRFEKVAAGRYTLLKFLESRKGPLLVPRQILSEHHPREAEGLARGLPEGRRWASGIPQRPGIGLNIDLGSRQSIAWVTLGCPRFPQDFPRRLKAFTSLDGTTWSPVALELTEPLVFTGQILLLYRGAVQRYRLTPAPETRFLRLELAEADPNYWWSVEKITLQAGFPKRAAILEGRVGRRRPTAPGLPRGPGAGAGVPPFPEVPPAK